MWPWGRCGCIHGLWSRRDTLAKAGAGKRQLQTHQIFPCFDAERAYTRANMQKQKILVLRLHEITKYAKVTDFTGIGQITFPSIRKSKGSRQKSSLVLGNEGIYIPYILIWASLVAQMIKNLLQCGKPRFNPWVGKFPWRKEWLPTPVFFPGGFHGQRRRFSLISPGG